MNIQIDYAPITHAMELVTYLLTEIYKINPESAQNMYESELKQHLDQLKPTSFLLSESEYVDKVYRDSYYNYYSSKLTAYNRNCIRISIFDGDVDLNNIDQLKSKYRGFILLRPTLPFIYGRSVISPEALINNNISCCLTKINATVNGVKVSVTGFPHSSQDTETMSCAETTLWEIMEYFGTKYPEYKPVLPSQIIRLLNKISFERQIPSKGLGIHQISFVLKEFGFGTRIYSRGAYDDQTFKRILSCYVESGIPVILGLDNFENNGSIGHAVLCIGHSSNINITSIPENSHSSIEELRKTTGITLHDWDDAEKDFVFIDDNCPIYVQQSLDTPTIHYPHSAWHDCSINHIIVPLYPKIYLEAYEAKHYALNFILTGKYRLSTQEVLVRFFLASSRTYKDALNSNNSFDTDVKALILETPMPKFLWVGELSTKSMMMAEEKKAFGLILIDATEPNVEFNKPLILAAYNNKVMRFETELLKVTDIDLPLQPFIIFEDNLKHSKS